MKLGLLGVIVGVAVGTEAVPVKRIGSGSGRSMDGVVDFVSSDPASTSFGTGLEHRTALDLPSGKSALSSP
jgi:hypothetical protein